MHAPGDPRSSTTHAASANPSKSNEVATHGETAPVTAAALPPVAVVFGREESGLTADEAQQCTHACGIPTGRLQPSMNLSHAAAVILAQAYDRAVCAGSGAAVPEDPGRHSGAGADAQAEASAGDAADAGAGAPERGAGAGRSPAL